MTAPRIFGDVYSGNCYKLLLACRFLNLDYDWRPVDILRGESQSREFLALNPNGKVPLLQLPDGRCLSESNAILNYLADSTPLLPSDSWLRAQVLQWQFFEQYSHEPYIAVARFIQLYLGLPKERQAEYAALQKAGHKALAVMERHLAQHEYFVAGEFSIADISLYAYTHRAHEGGFELQNYTAIQDWLHRVSRQPGHISMEAAAEEIGQKKPRWPGAS